MRFLPLNIFLAGLVALALGVLFIAVAGQVSATKDVVTSIDTDANVILHDAAWKTDGSYALIVGDDGTVLKYNGTSATILSSNTTDDLYGVSWKSDGSYALITGHNYTILKYDEANFTAINNTIMNDTYGVAWAPDGSFALISGLSGKVMKYDGTNLTEVYSEFDNMSIGGVSIAYNQNSEAVIVGDCGYVLMYNGTNITLLHNATGPLSNMTYSQNIAWHPNGNYALIVGLNGFAAKYENGNFSELNTGTTEDLYGIAWCPASSYALITGSSGTILKYDGTRFFKVGDESGKILFKVSWKPNSSEAVIVGYYDEQLPSASIIQKGLVLKFVSNGSADPCLTLSQITTSPATPGINESIHVSVDITNIDPYIDTVALNVLFSVNGSVLYNKSVILDPAEKRTVESTVYGNFTPGDYVLKVTVMNGSQSTYDVTKNITIQASLNVTASISLDPTYPLDINETVNISVRIKNNNSGLATTLVNASLYLGNTTILASGDFLQIKPTESVYLNFTWSQAIEGNYTISVKIKTQNAVVNETTKQIIVEAKSTDTLNNAPQLEQIANQTRTLGTMFTLLVAANDPDNDTMTYSIEAPTGANLTINSAGHITGTPTTTGTFSIKVIVSDGKNSTNTTFALTVNPVEEKKETVKTTGFLPGFEVLCAIAVIGAVVVMYRKRK